MRGDSRGGYYAPTHSPIFAAAAAADSRRRGARDHTDWLPRGVLSSETSYGAPPCDVRGCEVSVISRSREGPKCKK